MHLLPVPKEGPSPRPLGWELHWTPSVHFMFALMSKHLQARGMNGQCQVYLPVVVHAQGCAGIPSIHQSTKSKRPHTSSFPLLDVSGALGSWHELGAVSRRSLGMEWFGLIPCSCLAFLFERDIFMKGRLVPLLSRGAALLAGHASHFCFNMDQ